MPYSLKNLSFSRFKAYFRVIEPVLLPPYTGSTFRGALGHALPEVRYGSGAGCDRCPDRSSCRYVDLYSYFFESPWDHPFIRENHDGLASMMQRETYPQPFVIDPPAGGQYDAGQMLELPFTLVGKGIEHFPFMACGLSKMADRRLGRGQGRVRLEAVADGSSSENGNEALVYECSTGEIAGPCEILDFNQVQRWVQGLLPSQTEVPGVKIKFLTPLRFKYDNKSEGPLTFEILMRNLLRRFSLLSVHSPIAVPIDHKRLLSLASSVQSKSPPLKPQRFERYSARQNRRIAVEGFVGEIFYSGNLMPFLPFLKIGEFLNVGKNASFGLGKYKMSFSLDAF